VQLKGKAASLGGIEALGCDPNRHAVAGWRIAAQPVFGRVADVRALDSMAHVRSTSLLESKMSTQRTTQLAGHSQDDRIVQFGRSHGNSGEPAMMRVNRVEGRGC
jgi:hypothetical protein